MSKRRTYSWDFKAEVLAVYEDEGQAAAARAFDVPARTVGRWAKASGVVLRDTLKEATESARDVLAARRLRIRDKLAERAEEMLDRMGEAVTVYVGSGATPIPVDMDRPGASTCKDLATTAAILIDKLRLEAGEATSRDEHTFTHASDAELIAEAEAILRRAADGD